MEEEEENPCMALLSLHNATGGRELDVMEYLEKCSGPSRVTSYLLEYGIPTPTAPAPSPKNRANTLSTAAPKMDSG